MCIFYNIIYVVSVCVHGIIIIATNQTACSHESDLAQSKPFEIIYPRL